MRLKPHEWPAHEHVYEWVDAGPYSDDIAYCICKICGQEKPGFENVRVPNEEK